jgi:maltose alpha-D-glucosyltransferase / alpha-amylase
MQIPTSEFEVATKSAAKPWFKEAVIYELHIKTFCDGNMDGIGDFEGLLSRLDYLKNLGITAIWLHPFYPSPLKDDGYDIVDYLDVNPFCGTLDDFRQFLDAAHQQELRVVTTLASGFTIKLTPPEVPGVFDENRGLPVSDFDGDPSWWFTSAGSRFAEGDLTSYIKSCRWFRSKSRSVLNASVWDLVNLPSESLVHLLIIAFNYAEGPRELYALAVSVVSDEEARTIEVEYPDTVIARSARAGDLMVDATSSQSFRRALLDIVAERRTVHGRVGRLVGTKSMHLEETLKLGPPQSSRILKAPQSNSSIIYDDKIYLKLFRKLEEGINPDLEMAKQLSDKIGFVNVPTYLGDVQYLTRYQDPVSLGMMQAFTPNEQDGWSHMLLGVERYFELVLAEPLLLHPPSVGLWEEIPVPFVSQLERIYLETVRLLGERTADMHLALAADTISPDFAPEPFSIEHQRSIFHSGRSQTKKTMTLLSRSVDQMEQYPKGLAERVLQRSAELTSCHSYLLGQPIDVKRIRIHGDYHLGQLLFTGKDFVILDFEGEPARPLGERRRKRSALVDVAGMFRSFHYGLLESRTVRPVDHHTFAAYADLWFTRASQIFLGAYMTKVANAVFIPKNHEDLKLLLRSFSILKAMYELRYELNNRPKWVGIPLRAILKLLDEGILQMSKAPASTTTSVRRSGEAPGSNPSARGIEERRSN